MLKSKLLGVRLSILLMAFLPLFSLATSFTPMFTPQVGAVSSGTIDDMAKAWLFMSAIQRGDLNNNVSSTWLDDFAVIGLDNNTAGIASYNCAVGYVGHMIASGDGRAYANYSYTNYFYPCFNSENRKSLFSPIASSMGYDSGTKFFERLGYVRATNGSGNYSNTKGKSQLDAMLQEKWGTLPYDSLGSGTTPNFIKYDILVSALRDQCNPKDSIFANPKAPSDSGPDILTLVDSNGIVGKFAVQVADDSKGVTVGKNTNAGESGSDGQMSCGQIKKALMDPSLANDYAAQIKTPDPTSPGSSFQNTTNNTSTPGVSTCKVDGIGWIICPVVNFLAKGVDAAYGVVSTLLTVQPLVSSAGDGIYSAWSIMRNFANVAFVIVFLIIIFSQLSSFGITNYGIKKMLPKLIISAILVNTSFLICAILVDLSNIIGSSITGLFKDLGASLTLPAQLSSTQTGDGWEGIAGGVLAGTIATGVSLYIGLTALLPILIAAAFAILVAFLVLTLRQALLVILIVIAPLAFVAYLLPNTEALFKKWRELLQTLLVMFPIISLVFGGSALASKIIMNTASGDPAQKITIQIMGAGVAIIPLLITPLIMKVSGGMLGKFGGVINNKGRGPFDRARKGADGFRKNRQQLRDARALNGDRRFGSSIVKRRAQRQAVLSQRERNYNNAKTGYIADTALSDNVSRSQQALGVVTGGRHGGNSQGDQLLNKMAAGGGTSGRNAALAQAVSIQAKIEAEEVTAASAVIKNMNLDRNQQAMRELSMGGQSSGLDGSNEAVRAAAMKNVVDSHDVGGVNQLLDSVSTMSQKSRESFADSLASSSQKPDYVGQSAITNIRQHGNLDAAGTTIVAKNSTQLTAEAINNNTYSVEKLATGDREELEHVARIAADPTIATNNAGIAANAATAQTDPRYSGRIGKNVNVVGDISRL
jgi:hypothetical protein